MKKLLFWILVFLISLNYAYAASTILVRETFDSPSNVSLSTTNSDSVGSGMLSLNDIATNTDSNNPTRIIQNITGTLWQNTGQLDNTTWNWQMSCDDTDAGSTFHGPQLVINNVTTPTAQTDWIWEVRSEDTDCKIYSSTGGGKGYSAALAISLFSQQGTQVNVSLYQNWSDGNNLLVWNVYVPSAGIMTKQGNFSTTNTPNGEFLMWAHESVVSTGRKVDNITACIVTGNRPDFGCIGPPPPPDTTPPNIPYYNVSDGSNCEVWNTNKNTACNTTDPTPPIRFYTDENAWCAIAASAFGAMDKNYTDMGASRNCTGASSGEGTTKHLCSVSQQDEIVYEPSSYIYISCKDSDGRQNKTSTSGALNISVSLEANAKNSIEQGIRNALLSGYSIYTDQRVYARNSANNQSTGRFDKVVKKLNKIWAFNRIGVSETHVKMFNITPVLYTLEFANKSQEYMENKTTELINATR